MKKAQKCPICKELFIPHSCRQITCGKIKCQKTRLLARMKEQYKQNKHLRKLMPKKKKEIMIPENPRVFSVTYSIIDEKWYWEAVADNGSKLANGPFDSIKEAKKDYEQAIYGGYE